MSPEFEIEIWCNDHLEVETQIKEFATKEEAEEFAKKREVKGDKSSFSIVTDLKEKYTPEGIKVIKKHLNG